MTQPDPLADVPDHVDEQTPQQPPLDELAGDSLRNAGVLDPQLLDLDVDDVELVDQVDDEPAATEVATDQQLDEL